MAGGRWMNHRRRPECNPPDSWLAYAFQKAMAIVDQFPSYEEAWIPLHTELWTTYKAAAPEAVPRPLPYFASAAAIFAGGYLQR